MPKFSHLLIIFTIPFSLAMFSKHWAWRSTTLITKPTLHHGPIYVPSQALRLRSDPAAVGPASADFGKAVTRAPAAVLYPSSPNDVVSLLNLSNGLASGPFRVAARGRAHSVRGQATAESGVVIEMSSLNSEIRAFKDECESKLGFCGFVDAGGEKMWVEVLMACIEEGLTPVSWTDYLYLTVGGTLSNGGISGQTFRYGPQISNVQELDVVTGKGELIRCSREEESELFNGVLGGLGQFGIITRARIPLQPAPKRVKWIRMLYDDFETFARDQELLISNNKDVQGIFNGLNYVEGTLLMPKTSPTNNWRSSFFSLSDQIKISSLQSPNGIIYCVEVAKFYDPSYNESVDKEVEEVLKDLAFIPGFIFTKDVSYIEFLNRVREGEIELQSKGLWDVPHPWLNLFVPKSQISEFNSAIFVNIIAKQAKATGPVLVYPMNRDKWDDRMSTAIPEEEMFYAVSFLQSSTIDGWKTLDELNKEILRLCEEKKIMIKQYLPHYYEGMATSKEDFWKNHFGKEWGRFEERKAKFDPKMILSPGQGIFN